MQCTHFQESGAYNVRYIGEGGRIGSCPFDYFNRARGACPLPRSATVALLYASFFLVILAYSFEMQPFGTFLWFTVNR